MALADTGITPEHTIMVGDDYQSDIIGASRCGIKGVLLKSGKYDYTKFPEKAFAVINGIGALPSWIENQ